MKLLLVEDDSSLVEYLLPILKKAGFSIETADNGIDGEFLGRELVPDMIILDLGLPRKNGLDILKSWRQNGINTPVLILTARDAWNEKVLGLQAGADDYLTKPFKSEELLARIHSVIRRYNGRAVNTLIWEGYILDPESQILTQPNSQENQLTSIEFRILFQMMSNPNKIHSKTSLSEHAYREEEFRDSNVIEVYINRLRKILGKSSIQTMRGQGYRLRKID